MMKKVGPGASPGRSSWRGTFRNAWKAAGSFLDLRGAEQDRRLDEEVRGLVEPSLPILIYKRGKLLASGHEYETPEAGWRTELERYVDRILWPLLSNDLAKRSEARARVLRDIDALVAAEAARTAVASYARPATWRAETGWAN